VATAKKLWSDEKAETSHGLVTVGSISEGHKGNQMTANSCQSRKKVARKSYGVTSVIAHLMTAVKKKEPLL